MYNKNDSIEVRITDLGSDGEGIGKIDGFPFFVKDSIPGDVIRAKVTKAKKNYAFARLESFVTKSSDRVEPVCHTHRSCGGCQLQMMSYEKQLEFKENKVYNHLLRIGGISKDLLDATMEPIVGMEQGLYYRNKAQYPIGRDKNGKPIAGFYASRTHSIVANTNCHLGRKENQGILETILAHMEKYQIPSYDENSGKGLFRHILIRTGFTSGQIMVCLIVNVDKRDWKKWEAKVHVKELIAELRKVEGMTSIMLNFNTRRDNVIMGSQVQNLWGEDTIEDSIHVCDVKHDFVKTGESLLFKISPLSFYQVNPEQTEKLYSIALDYAKLTGKETVWDLYCGIGTISLFLSQRAGKVYGVEIIPEAIRDAKENAIRNQIDNAEFFVGKAEEVLPKMYQEQGTYAEVIVVDPPRKGCDSVCLETMIEMAPKRIVYVSCDSATLARDVKILAEGGYQIEKWRAVDQFAQTAGVETVCLLSKLNVDHHIEVELNMDELDLTSAESKATYAEIKDYVLENSGLKVSSLYIAQVKDKMGIKERENFNLSKKDDAKVPVCPADKEKAIIEALEHFNMID